MSIHPNLPHLDATSQSPELLFSSLIHCHFCENRLVAPTTLLCGHSVCSVHVTGEYHPPIRPQPTITTQISRTGPNGRGVRPSRNSTSAPPRPHPSCPIQSCSLPTGARPLRNRSHNNDSDSSTVSYHPPPNDTFTRVPPPPSANVKVPMPKLDVTLTKVISAANKFLPPLVQGTLPSQPTALVLPSSSSRSHAISPPLMSENSPRLVSVRPTPNPASVTRLESDEWFSDVASDSSSLHRAVADMQVGPPAASDAFSSTPLVPSSKRRRTGSRSHVHSPTRTEESSLENNTTKPNDATLISGSLKDSILPELTCEICYSLFLDPVTTPCEHTFCSRCLLRSLDHSPLCPLCREDLPGFAHYHDHPSNSVLLSIITSLFPNQYADRVASLRQEDEDPTLKVPIFVCQLSFPGTPTNLHFFEPRYRLMLRRCLGQPQHEFGMILPPREDSGEEMTYGTMLQIRKVEMLADGRSLVKTFGTYRFRILERGRLDGYMVAKIERIEDFSPEMELSLDAAASPSSPPPSSAIPLPYTEQPSSISSSTPKRRAASLPLPPLPPSPVLVAKCHAFLSRMQSRVPQWVVDRMYATYGPVPEDLSDFSFWMALVLPIDDYEKAKLLSLRSPRLRLRLVVHWIDATEKQHWWQRSGNVQLALFLFLVTFSGLRLLSRNE